MVKKVGNLIPNTFFITKGSGESDLEKHAGSYHMALYDAGISDFNIMTYSSVIPATAHLATMDELDLPPFGSEMKTIMAVSHGYQDEFVSAGVVYAWMYKDENFDEKVGGLVCEVSGRYRIEELESRRLYMPAKMLLPEPLCPCSGCCLYVPHRSPPRKSPHRAAEP